jgi:hypothetical protein
MVYLDKEQLQELRDGDWDPKSMLEARAESRANVAKEVRMWRRIGRKEMAEGELVRFKHYDNGFFSQPLTPKFCYSQMLSNIRAFKYTTPNYGEWSDDYYSACGHDDYLGDMHDGLKMVALQWLRMWKYQLAQHA